MRRSWMLLAALLCAGTAQIAAGQGQMVSCKDRVTVERVSRADYGASWSYFVTLRNQTQDRIGVSIGVLGPGDKNLRSDPSGSTATLAPGGGAQKLFAYSLKTDKSPKAEEFHTIFVRTTGGPYVWLPNCWIM